MKNLVILFACLLTAIEGTAAPISAGQAREAAAQFLSRKAGSHRAAATADMLQPIAVTGLQIQSDGRQIQSDHPALYAVNVGQNNGYVLVSGSDMADAVIGYCDHGTFDETLMPDNMRAWLNSYCTAIATMEAADRTASRRATQATATKSPIAPLMKSQWNQKAPYNSRCPILKGTFQESPTGCTITAMAQIMNYHQWPKAQTPAIPGYTFKYNYTDANQQTSEETFTMDELEPMTFEWDKIYPSYNNNEDGMEVALLMEYLGAASKTTYGIRASSATGYDALLAMTTYFGYDKGARVIWRNQRTYDEYTDMLYDELKAKRPVMFSGTYPGGAHSFVVDGYDEEDFFHVNWGWGGISDGYYRVVLMNPTNQGVGGSSTDEAYALDQVAFIGIQPDKGNSDTSQPRLTLLSAALFYDGLGNGYWDTEGTESTSVRYPKGYIVLPKIATRNYNSVAGAFDLGLRLVKDDGTFSRDYAWDNMTGKKYIINEAHKYKEGEFFYLDPQNDPLLTDGNYKLYFISKLSTSDTWLLDENGDQRYVSLTLDHAHGKMTARLIDNGPRLKVGNVSSSTPSPMVGAPTVITVRLTNEGKSNYHYDLLLTGKEKGKEFASVLAGTACSIAPGETSEVSMTWVPKTTGDITCQIVDNSDTVLSQFDFTVLPSEYSNMADLTITPTVTNADANRRILGPTANINLNATNATDTNFKGHFTVVTYYYNNASTAPIRTEATTVIATVPAHSTVNIPVVSKELTGAEWFCFSYHYFKGEKQGDDIVEKQVNLEFDNIFYTIAPYFTLFDASGKATYCPASATLKPDATLCAVDLTTAPTEPAIDRSAANPNLLIYTGKNSSLSGDNIVKGDQAENITLTDGHPFIAPFPFIARHISYTRTAQGSYDAGRCQGWTTLTLPFAATSCQLSSGSSATPLTWLTDGSTTGEADICIMHFNSENGSTIELSLPGSTLEANHPYMLGVPAATRSGQTLKGQPVTFAAYDAAVEDGKSVVTGRNYKMVGVTLPLTDEKDIYVLNAEGSAFVRGTASISPFHACFAPISVQATDPQLTIAPIHTPTGIQDVNDNDNGNGNGNDNGNGNGNWYDLQGRRISNSPSTLSKGLFIRNGKKTVIR